MKKLLLVLSAALIGTTAQAADKMTLQLNWFHLADHSPIYMALKKGYYKEEDLELNVVRGAGSADSAKIDLKQAEVGISDAPTVITAISKGANLRMVAVVYDKAGNNAFFKKGANIRRPRISSARRSRCRRQTRTACSGPRSPRSTSSTRRR